jgi:hypothetical protein
MDIRKFENLILSEIEKVVKLIIKENPDLSISARARAGAEISDFLEEQFVKQTKKHKYFIKSEKSPSGETKNPWDARTYFRVKSIEEEIWIDFKALKITSADSNPDIGTPNKIIEFIKRGHFYLVYSFVYYEETKSGLKFVENEGRYTKTYFLKDVHHTFRRNPKNQLQVNISEPPEYRTREDFIKLLLKKLHESHSRQIEISNKALSSLDETEAELIKQNKISEAKILKDI